VSVCLCVSVHVRVPKGKWLELPITNLVDIMHGKPPTSTDSEVKRSKIKVRGLSSALPACVYRSVRLLRFIGDMSP